ncbi:hypothetical protein [Hamadaea tsunoensis]|nr:hypothetical protein [Hamadaea tsunoensis]
MTTQEILADRPSRVEIMTGLTSGQVDRLLGGVLCVRAMAQEA